MDLREALRALQNKRAVSHTFDDVSSTHVNFAARTASSDASLLHVNTAVLTSTAPHSTPATNMAANAAPPRSSLLQRAQLRARNKIANSDISKVLDERPIKRVRADCETAPSQAPVEIELNEFPVVQSWEQVLQFLLLLERARDHWKALDNPELYITLPLHVASYIKLSKRWRSLKDCKTATRAAIAIEKKCDSSSLRVSQDFIDRFVVTDAGSGNVSTTTKNKVDSLKSLLEVFAAKSSSKLALLGKMLARAATAEGKQSRTAVHAGHIADVMDIAYRSDDIRTRTAGLISGLAFSMADRKASALETRWCDLTLTTSDNEDVLTVRITQWKFMTENERKAGKGVEIEIPCWCSTYGHTKCPIELAKALGGPPSLWKCNRERIFQHSEKSASAELKSLLFRARPQWKPENTTLLGFHSLRKGAHNLNTNYKIASQDADTARLMRHKDQSTGDLYLDEFNLRRNAIRNAPSLVARVERIQNDKLRR